MLAELRVENLGLLKDVRLELGPGLNVITGETGAGKTLCVEALSYLCGARASKDVVGPWGSSATIEARFVFPDGGMPGRRGDGDDPLETGRGDEVVVRRVLDASGRSRQYLNGRMATLGELEAAVGELVEIYGQGATNSLADPRVQLELVDRFCGSELDEVAAQYGSAYREAKDLERTLSQFEDPSGLAREIDFLKFQIAEISAAKLKAGEEEDLRSEALRLENSAELMRAARGAFELLDSAEDAVGSAAELGPGQGIDPSLDGLRERCRALAAEIQELRRDFRAYGEAIEVDEDRLLQVRERLDLIGALKRKYGTSIEEVLAFADKAEKRLGELLRAEELNSQAAEKLRTITGSLLELAGKLSALRRQGAARLEEAVRALLARVGMAKATFAIEVQSESPAWPGSCGPSGADKISFVFSSAAGVAPRSLGKVASGGELARLMLAIEVAIGSDRGTPTIVFDEVDQGIGGRTALAIGELLASLAKKRQILCVTHLAQVASFGEVHLLVTKDGDEAEVAHLEEKERVLEISRMLGGVEDSEAARRHAREILERAAGRRAS